MKKVITSGVLTVEFVRPAFSPCALVQAAPEAPLPFCMIVLPPILRL
jgi:hypothetical protein